MEEELVTEFAKYCLKYKSYPFEQLIKTFYCSLSQEDRDFFASHWELCVNPAEAVVSSYIKDTLFSYL